MRTEVSFFLLKTATEPIKMKEQGGIGLANVKRRLELLYPEKHKLIVSDDDNKFSIYLKLEIS